MTAAEICSRIEQLEAKGVGLGELLDLAVDALHRANPRFHWTGIYELCADRVLRLGPYRGSATDHVFIGIGEGVCGTAVAERRNLNVPDVSKVENYLACSTATRSELVVLIREGETIYAQIDVDSHELDAFDARSVSEVERVADCLGQVYGRHLSDPGLSDPGGAAAGGPRLSDPVGAAAGGPRLSDPVGAAAGGPRLCARTGGDRS